MSPISTTLAEWNQNVVPDDATLLAQLQDRLCEVFGTAFHIYDAEGEVLKRVDGLPEGDTLFVSTVASRVAERCHAEVIAEESATLLLAIPTRLGKRNSSPVVAVAPFVTASLSARPGEIEANASLLGVSTEKALNFTTEQPLWTPNGLLRLAHLFLDNRQQRQAVHRLEGEVDKLSQNLTSTYEEICLLYGVTQNLRISSSDEDLGRLALDWLTECLPAKGVAIHFVPIADEDATYEARSQMSLLSEGECPIDSAQFEELVKELELGPKCGPLVLNDIVTSEPDWKYPEIRQLIIVPLSEGSNLFGWLAAFNHVQDFEFGTVEASLLNSIGAILGIHSGNRELYRQQAEFLATVVRALTSAIDAKDPYTCGHSDRVARVAVRLAREIGCDTDQLNTLYMAGLLHDVGKIGIDDVVLRKPERLTDEEFEHIKLHPELGHKILCDIKQLADVLPIVLHHHEQWDGGGYPHGLRGEETPLMARITAVADAFDAMTSDRPYRKGMPLDKVEKIFSAGAGKQWDSRVIEAFFAAQDDIIDIMRRERANLSLDVQTWINQMGLEQERIAEQRR